MPPQVHRLSGDSCRLGHLPRAAVGNSCSAVNRHVSAHQPNSHLESAPAHPPACRILLADCEDGRRQTVDPKTVAACASAQVRATSAQLLAAGFGAVSVMSKRGKLAPLRTVFYHNQGEGHACVLRSPACKLFLLRWLLLCRRRCPLLPAKPRPSHTWLAHARAQLLLHTMFPLDVPQAAGSLSWTL